MIIWIAYSLIACACLIFVLRPLALNLSFVDEPSNRKQHSGSIPLIGGVAVYLTLFSAILLFLPTTSSTIDLLLALTACVMIGGYDDKFDMNPRVKFFLQLGIAIFLAYKSNVQLHYFGNLIGFGPLDLGIFSGPVAIFSMIVGMNAFNMLDGIDGLSASLALVCILAMALITGSEQIQLIGVVMVAALSVFLVFNLGVLGTKYKIFLGDNGSMMIGLVIAWFLIVASQKAIPDFKPVTAIWLIAIPLIDMTSVMFKRLRRGESMLSADREHLHHKFMDLGFSPRATLLIIVSISIITIGIGYALDFSGVPEYIGFYVFLALLILYNLLQAKLFEQNALSSKKMTVYISVVSHGHFDLIKELDCLVKLADEAAFKIYILDNVSESGFEDWCAEHKINYLQNSKPKGFGENNNIIFKHIKAQEKTSTNDKFLVLNPDVLIEVTDILKLVNEVDASNAKIATINLFKDIEYTQYDFSVRNYTNFADYMSSMFLGKNTSIIDKSTIKQASKVDWAAGSFLLFDFEHFDKLNGFDGAYHMYCEDIDICLRSDVIFGEKVLYFPTIKAVHLAQHASRSLFSKHLYWHLCSMFKYLWKKRKLSK